MVSPVHKEVGPEIVSGVAGGRTVMESVCDVPFVPQILEGVTVRL